jgi:mRNA interferase RelE/StbE
VKVTFRQSFARDLKKIKDKAVFEQIKRAIERVETAQNLSSIKELGKLSGSTGYYRIRIGVYRLGIAVQNDEVAFVWCLHRRDIYRYFPR